MTCAKLAPLALAAAAASGFPAAQADSGWSQLNMPRGVTEISRKIYDHLDQGVSYYSRLDRRSDAARELLSGIDPHTVDHYLLNVDHPLVVPVDTKVRLLITAADVIHSWWVPALGVKKDAIPGFVNEAWFKVDPDKPGLYRGQCAELCGRDHAFMPIVVDVRSKAEFAAWRKEK